MGLMPSDSQVVMVNGEPVRCFCAGSGPPLVLLHGLGGAAVVWYRNLPVLAEHYTVYAPDLWGPGRHSGSQSPTPERGVRFLFGFMDALGHTSAHVVGSSLGGLIAGFAAAHDPSRMKSLTLVDSAGLGREIAFSQRLISLPIVGEIVFRSSLTRVKRLLRMLVRNDQAVTAELTDALYEARAQPGVAHQMLSALRAGVNIFGVRSSVQIPDLRVTGVPTLIVWGALDPLLPLAHARSAERTMPGSKLVVIDNVGHWGYLEAPERFNDVLLEFLDTNSRLEANRPLG
jgi:pimeloyl-ACP methyl ester carboxylesterase